jgi:hypothetical protein
MGHQKENIWAFFSVEMDRKGYIAAWSLQTSQ